MNMNTLRTRVGSVLGQSTGHKPADPGTTPSTRLFLLVVASSVFVSVLTGSMVNVVLPFIRVEFAASAAQLGWVVTGYALAYAVGIPLYGRLSDLFGVRRVYTVGVAGFVLGGLICAVAPTLGVLVAGRIVQGLGGGAVPALASVVVAKVFPPGSRGGALGAVASSVGVGSVVGPVAGGVLGGLFGWRALFMGSLLLMLLLLPFAQRVLPDDRSSQGERFDLLGAALLGLGAGLFLLSITQGQSAGFGAPSAWGCLMGAVVAAVGFTWRITHTSDPFVSPALFQNGGYVAAMLVGIFAMFTNLSALVFAPLLLVEVNGLSAGVAGLVLTPSAVALTLLSPLTGRLSDRIGVRIPLFVGLTLLLCAMLGLSTFAGSALWLVAAGLVGLGVGLAFIQSPANNAAANELSAAELGSGMGLFSGALFLGGGAAPALIGAVLAARQEAQAIAFNPLYALDAAPFSDAFLVVALGPALGLLAALALRSRVGDTHPEHSVK